MNIKNCFFSVLCLAGTAFAAHAAVDINETNFPDANFRKFITQRIDLNSDNVLSDDEIQATTKLEMNYKYIKNLKGIEYFTQIDTLFLDSNSDLKEMDLSHNTKLMDLSVNNCGFTSLDLSAVPSLKRLSCTTWGGTTLKSINVSGNPLLEYLRCYGNKGVTSLDLSQNPNLQTLICYNTGITSLDLSHNPELTELTCNNLDLTSLDLSALPKLKTLIVNKTKLTSLDLSHNPLLYELECQECALESLDVTQNPELGKLTCSFNKLTSLDLSHNPQLTKLLVGFNTGLLSLDVTHNPLLNDLETQSCPLTSLDVTHNPELATLNCYGAQLQSIDLSQNTKLSQLNLVNNPLVALDLTANTELSIHGLSGFKRTVKVDQNTRVFDLATLAADGFDVSKASNWTGGTVDGNKLTFTADQVTYKYFTNATNVNYRNLTFTLIPELVTAVDGTLSANVSASYQAGAIRISGASQGTPVQLFNAAGAMVYSGTSHAIAVEAPGVYVARVGGTVVKVLVN